ncbi:hypothetical protein [Nostoc punctiforme]|nr:hypothetical protein [Nostoc punctiforme]
MLNLLHESQTALTPKQPKVGQFIKKLHKLLELTKKSLQQALFVGAIHRS